MLNETSSSFSSSTHRSVAAAGVHLFKVVGHSVTGRDTYITSKPFRAGGHDWAIKYYPSGDAQSADIDGGPWTSVYLMPLNAGELVVKAHVSFFLLQDEQPPAPGTTTEEEKKKLGGDFTDNFSSANALGLGMRAFVAHADLAASGCLKDDCLLIKCTVRVVTSELIDGHGHEDDGDESGNGGGGVVVPPSDMTRNFGNLLESGVATDITVRMGWFTRFRAHRCVLAAQSPVFRALLCGSMRESGESSIRVDDMGASVFELLLHYMYNDSLPASMAAAEEETTNINMAQHLLVAADRYGMERLKAICEAKLSKALDVDTAAATLELAERHHCRQLKDCCLRFMARDRERLKAIMETQGFTDLNQNFPLIMRQIIDRVLHC